MRGSLAAIVLLVAAPATAQDRDEAAVDLGAMSDAELVARVDAYDPKVQHSCSDLLPLYVELDRRYRRDRRWEPGVLFGQTVCAYDEQRYAEGMRFVKRFERDYPERGPLGPLGFLLALQLDDRPEMLAQLRALSAAGLIGALPEATLRWSFRALRDDGHGGELDSMAYQIAQSSAFAGMDLATQEMLAAAALAHAARTGETARVDALLGNLRSPYSILDVLALRKYEAIWPQVERRAGDNLMPLSDDYVSWAATRAADEPEDRDRLSDYSYALLFAGRFREAVDLAEAWLDTRQHEGEIEEGDGWALNIQAYAYDALGRSAEADRVFDRLAQLPPDDHPWVVNFVINRADRLLELGRWDESLAAIEVARPVADAYGSPYARMLVASYRVCALHKLGRPAEAETPLDFVREHFADAPTVGAEALLCADRDDEAARLVARVLADEGQRGKLLEDLQDERFTLFGSPGSQLRQTRDLILARPELRELALQHVRLLPDRFVPIAYVRRQALAGGPGTP